MRRFTPSFPFLLVFLIAPALVIFGLSSGLLHGVGAGAAALPDLPDTAEEAYSLGVQRFEDQRYADAVELLEAAPTLPGEVDPRARTFYLQAAKLRLATVQGDTEAMGLAKLALLTLVTQEMDDWGARGVRELVAAGYGTDGDVARLLGGALQHWEQAEDVAAATKEYVELYRVLLDPNRRWQSVNAPLLRMWENLVTANAPREDLLDLGALILEGRPYAGPVPLPSNVRRQRIMPPSGTGFDRSQLVRRVATDVLGLEPPGWLAASAHEQLAEQAEMAGHYREAEKHLRAALAAADPAQSWAAATAKQRLTELLRPRVDVSGTALYRPGSHHSLSVSWRNLASWNLEIRRIDPTEDWALPTDRRAPRNSLADYLTAGAGVHVRAIAREDEEELASREVAEKPTSGEQAEKPASGESAGTAREDAGTPPEPHVPRSDVVWLDPLDPGIYLVTLTGTQIDEDRDVGPAKFVFQVTDLGLTFQRVSDAELPQGDLELWLVDMASGEPVSSASLALHTATIEGDQLVWGSTSVSTDLDGLARTDLPVSRVYGSLVAGEVEGRPVVALDFRTLARPGTSDPWRSYLLTDRPLYRPGETVHLQAFLRTRDVRERRSVVPDDRSVELVITAPDGSEFLRRPFTLDDDGALETAIDLPDHPALGRYNVQLRLPSPDRWIGGGGFQVDEYRLPEFVVHAGLDESRRYVLGDTLDVTVDAEYLFGGPVRGSAEVVVTRQPLWVIYQPWVRFDWLREEKMSPYPSWRYGGEEVLRITQPLDADGHLTVAVPTSMRESNPLDYTYTIEARITDSSRREESGRASARVTRQELYAYLTPERHVVAPGDEARVGLRVQDAMDRPAEVAGRWTVERQDKDGTTEELLSRNTKTATDGKITLSFTPSRAGYYTLRFATQDARAHDVTAVTTVWCADPKTTKITHSAGALQLIAEKDEFLTDDVARVLLVSDTAGVPVYLSEHFAGEVETRVVRMTGTVQLLEIPLDRLHRPYFYIRAVRARDFLLQQATARIVAPLGDQALDVSVAFDHESYEPGEKADLQIKAMDALGNPVAAPVTVAVVDEAVLAILPRDLSDPNRVFNRYDTPRPSDLPVSASWFGGYRFFDEAGKEARDEWGQLNEREDKDLMKRQPMAAGREMPVEEAATADMAAGLVQSKAEPATPPALGGPAAPTTIRTDFRTTALWRTAVLTDADGTATVEVPLAQSLTRWEALAVAITPQSRAGMGTTKTQTRKDVMVRLNHPRVFREMDRILFAATVHNETDEDLGCRVSLTAEDLKVEGESQTITVAAHAQAQVEWWAAVPAGSARLDYAYDDQTKRIVVLPSEALVRVTAQTRVDSDAFERKVKLLVHGTDLRVVAAGEARSGTSTLSFTLPSDRLTQAEVATLTLSPSVLSACIDALPFLAEYPYGCTEQTLSRFVPAVAVRHVVETLGVSSKRIDPELDAKIGKGLRRIADFQHGDGGWGWWKEDETNAYMTAYVLVALSRAKESGADVSSDMLRRGREALRGLLPSLEQRPDDMAYGLFSISCVDQALSEAKGVREDETMQRYALRLFDQRDQLRDYARALLALYLQRAGQPANALLALQNLDNTAQIDDEYDTVHWGRVRGYWWRGEGAVETTAFVLQAYGEIAPDHANYRRAARWLVTNRTGVRWDNTRATAHVIYALVDFAAATKELEAEYTLVATIDGYEVARFEVAPESIVDGGGQFEVPAEFLSDGSNQVQLALEGKGICYATISVQTYTRAEDPAPTKNYLGVEREVVRLRPLRTLGGSILQVETPLHDGDAVDSGDRIRVRLHLTAHNDLEYLAIEDPRPAGAEPVDQLSGWFWSGSVGGRREIRDELTAFFVSSLAQGEHVLEYELRAESPGVYHVMPTRAYAMYVPDVNGSSTEFHLEITAGQPGKDTGTF